MKTIMQLVMKLGDISHLLVGKKQEQNWLKLFTIIVKHKLYQRCPLDGY